MLHQDSQSGESLLRVPGLVGLDRGQQVRPVDVAGRHRVGGERDELDVGEAVLDGQVRGQRRLDAVGAQHDVVEQVPDRDYRPLVGVERALRPVEPRVVLQQLVRESQVKLGMPGLVEHAEHAEVAPLGRWGEPAEPALHGDRHVLDHADAAHVQLRGGHVRRVELLVNPGPGQGIADRLDAGLLFPLDPDVVAV